MTIKGDLKDLYSLGQKILPEMSNCFAAAANELNSVCDAGKPAFTRTEEDPSPIVEGVRESQGASFAKWEEYRDAVHGILKRNAESLANASEFIIGAADDYSMQDGYNSDEIDAVKESIDSPEPIEID